MNPVSEFRIHACNHAPVNPRGEYVLYWMIANRRTEWNFSLQRAVEWARKLDKPIVVFEALRCGYKWASDRLHWFIIQGMRDNAERLDQTGVLYVPYLEREPERGKGLLAALGDRSCVVVTDDFPSFFLPRMISAAAAALPVLVEKVDSNGMLPMSWTDKVFSTAFSFRRFLQKNLDPHIHSLPAADPLAEARLPGMRRLPKTIRKQWPLALDLIRKGDTSILASFPIDHSVSPSRISGGPRAGARQLEHFLDEALPRYADGHNHPDEDATSGLSPYLHFGHIGVHQVFHELMKWEGWSSDMLSPSAQGKRAGWWGVGENAEAFLDELITWREIGYNMCSHRSDYDRYESLPEWARETLETHQSDPRPYVYTLEQLENAQTHDEVWNAAQRELVRDGRVHNYLRMLWGKKILEWSRTPGQALDIMIELNNKYALDGRNPNSYSGIFWILGRYDRPWGPERAIFGKIRYMSSENTKRKLRLARYLEEYGP